jgi:two-component system nitrate/nitrite response regulator NarL
VAICDDHSVFADCLAVLLDRSGYTVTGVTNRPSDAVELLRDNPTDVCLLDCSFPDAHGLDHVSELREAAPDCRIILLSAQLDADTVARGAQSHVAGYARKQQPLSELLEAIARVGAGQMSIPDDLLVGVLSTRRAGPRGARGELRDLCRFFTPRERQVLQGMVRGLGTPELARELGISATTTRGHVQAVLTKLGVHSRLKAAVLAVREGVVAADSGEWLLDD